MKGKKWWALLMAGLLTVTSMPLAGFAEEVGLEEEDKVILEDDESILVENDADDWGLDEATEGTGAVIDSDIVDEGFVADLSELVEEIDEVSDEKAADQVAQIGTVTYSTFVGALQAATDNDTIIMTADSTENSGKNNTNEVDKLSIDKTITINLAGHKLQLENYYIDINGKNVSITDNSENKGELVVNTNYNGNDICAAIEVRNAELKTNAKVMSAYDSVLYAGTGGTIVIEDGEVATTSGLVAGMAAGSGKIVVNNGTISSNNWTTLCAIKWGADQGGTIEINNGTITKAVRASEDVNSRVIVKGGAIGTSGDYGVYVNDGASGEVAGGTIKPSAYGVYVVSGNSSISQTANIEGNVILTTGNLTISDGATVNGYIYTAGTGRITVNGGTVKGDVYPQNGGKIEITGGTIAGTVTAPLSNSTLQITGGKFANKIDSYLPDSAISEADPGTDGYYNVVPAVLVTFDTDGGTECNPQKIKAGTAVTKPTAPVKAGQTFDKWVLGDAEYDFNGSVEQNITLKAVYKTTEFDSAVSWSNKIKEEQNNTTLTWDDVITAAYWYGKASDKASTQSDSLAESDRTKLATATANLQAVTKLDLNGQKTSQKGFDISTGALVYFTNLEELNLSDTGLEETGGLRGLTKLKKLDLSSNAGIDIDGLAELTSLESLNLSATGFDNDSFGPIVKLTHLKQLNLSHNAELSAVGPLAANTALEDLDVSSTGLRQLQEPYTFTQVIKKLTAKNLELNHESGQPISGLVLITNRADFQATGVEWDLSGSTLYDDVNGKYFSRKNGIYFSRNAANYFPEFAAFYFPVFIVALYKPTASCQ